MVIFLWFSLVCFIFLVTILLILNLFLWYMSDCHDDYFLLVYFSICSRLILVIYYYYYFTLFIIYYFGHFKRYTCVITLLRKFLLSFVKILSATHQTTNILFIVLSNVIVKLAMRKLSVNFGDFPILKDENLN